MIRKIGLLEKLGTPGAPIVPRMSNNAAAVECLPEEFKNFNTLLSEGTAH